jgi:hypothetical protein
METRKFIKRNLIIIGLCGLALAIRLSFLSPWLEDWDSIQFSLALHDFDLGNNIPHAPGYPLYVAVGKLFYIFIKSDILALNLVSTLSGTLSIVLIYLLTLKMFSKKEALIASLIFSITPISMIMSITPLTNMTGLFTQLIFVYLIYTRFSLNPKFVTLVGGLILGFRFTELPIILSLLALATLKHKKLSQLLNLAFSFILGMLFWIVPLILVSGIKDFVKAYTWIAKYVIYHDSLLAQSLSERIKKLSELLDISFTSFFIWLVIISFGLIIIKRIKKYPFIFLAVWFLSYFIPLLFVYNLEVPRYTLPLLPVFAISASLLIKKHKIAGFLVFIALIAILSRQSYSQAKRLSITTPPSIAPVIYVKNNFEPDETVIVVSYTYRQFQYYAPQFESIYSDQFSEKNFPYKKYVILDYNGLSKILPKDFEYHILNQVSFKGDKDIYSRISETNIIVLEKDEN